MIEFIFVLLVLVIVVGICLHHHSMKTQLYESSDCDARMIRDAAQYAIRAANSTSSLIAIMDIISAIQILEDLLKRHTASTANTLAGGIDVPSMLKHCVEQRDKILQDLTRTYPEMLPNHKLAGHAGFKPLERMMRKEEEEESSNSSDEETNEVDYRY